MKHLLFAVFILLSNYAFSQNWQANFNEAKTLAQQENKNMILVFSGSDWCAPCIKLKQSILESEVFKNESDKNWILYNADFPKKKANKLSDQLSEENGALAEKYNQKGTFPLLLLLNTDGNVLGSLGFENISPDDYVKKIHNLVKK
jgi:thioredoxin-related protein